MLKLNHLFENFELAKEALTHWNYDTDTLEEMLEYFRISSNAIYPFKVNGQVQFLRLAPTEEKLAQNLEGELDYIQYLVKQQFPALEPVLTLEGHLYLTLDTQWGTYYASVFKRVKGISLEDVEFSSDIMNVYGQTLGRLHQLSKLYGQELHLQSIPALKWSHLETLDWIECELKAHFAPDYLMTALSNLRLACSELEQTDETYGLVHYDFELDNVFYDAESGICSVIDFDDSMYHWYTMDIVQALDSMENELDESYVASAQQAFLDGYQSVTTLSSEQISTFPLMRRFAQLYQYARVKRSLSVVISDEPDWMKDLRVRLESKLLKIETSYQ